MTRKLVAQVQTPLDPGARDHCCGSGGNKSGIHRDANLAGKTAGKWFGPVQEVPYGTATTAPGSAAENCWLSLR